MYKIGINVTLMLLRLGTFFYLKTPTQKSVYPFYESLIKPSPVVVLCCVISFSGYSAVEMGLTFEKMEFWVFSGGWDMFF